MSDTEKNGKEASKIKIPEKDHLKLHNLKQSSESPFMQIHENHENSMLRIIKTIIVVVAILGLAILTYFELVRIKEKSQRDEKLRQLENVLSDIDAKLARSSGYEKDKTALETIPVIDKAIKTDLPSEKKKWLERKDKYLSIIRSNAVLPGTAKDKNFINAVTCSDMLMIPPGRFMMGRGPWEYGKADESPRRAVTIRYEFWMSRCEISNAQFKILFPKHNSGIWNNYDLDRADLPAVNINWHTATAFCMMLTERERLMGRIPLNYEYRLPSEAEWEYACRAGTDSPYFWGDSFENKGAEFANSLDKKTAVLFGWQTGPNMADDDRHRVASPGGAFKANAFGLCDMSGNVWEWCLDWYSADAYKFLPPDSPFQSRKTESSLVKYYAFDAGTYTVKKESRVIRGGSWGNLPAQCRSAARDHAEPDKTNTGIGFRIVLAPEVKSKF